MGHQIMAPILLRRLKDDVEKNLPSKEEIVIQVEMTTLQKQYYRALYEKNTAFLYGNRTAGQGPSLMNLHMELRKCCNHPFLNRGVEDDVRTNLKKQRREILLQQKLLKSQSLSQINESSISGVDGEQNQENQGDE